MLSFVLQRMLLIACYIGAVTMAACTGITPTTWWLAAPLLVIATVCGGLSSIMQVGMGISLSAHRVFALCEFSLRLQNAFLPLLAKAMPESREREC